MTQEELAERADVSPKYISELERGIAAASFETAGRLAMALRVTVAELFPDNVHRAAVRQHRHEHRAGAEPSSD
jgi:transcriptional regulator with XRE-family HTH domain